MQSSKLKHMKKNSATNVGPGYLEYEFKKALTKSKIRDLFWELHNRNVLVPTNFIGKNHLRVSLRDRDVRSRTEEVLERLDIDW